MARIQNTHDELQSNLAALIENQARLSGTLESQSKARMEVREQLHAKQQEVRQADQNLKSARSQFDQALKYLTSTSDLKSLEELERAREGMANGPKKVLDWARKWKIICRTF